MKKKEIKRQILHIGIGLFTVILIYFDIVEEIGRQYPFTSLYFLPEFARPFLILLIVNLVLSILSKKGRVPIVEWFLKKFERSEDRKILPGKGLFFTLLGIFILSLFVEKAVIGASLLIISVGDSVSHLVGKKFGEVDHPLSHEKKIEGHLVGAFLSGVGASIFINPVIAFIAAFLAMFIEGVEFGEKIDRLLEDNLFIPLIAATIIIILRQILF